MNRRYIRRRLLQVVPAVAGILLVGFLLIELAPGDPLLALAGDSGDAAYYAEMRARFGLDEPLPARFAAYVTNVVRGDFGVSYVQGRPAIDVILERLPSTLLLSATALVVSTVVGITLGIIAAVRHRRLPDVVIQFATLTIDAAPVFWLGQLALLGLALHLALFPVQGIVSARSPDGFLGGLVDLLWHLALPAGVLALGEIAVVARMTRIGFLEELSQDYVRTARAKGLGSADVLVVHVMRRALIPAVTVIGSRIGHLVSGAVVIETIFGWPGLGRMLVLAMQTRDMPIIMGMFVIVSFTVILANLLTDLCYGWLDPRVAYR